MEKGYKQDIEKKYTDMKERIQNLLIEINKGIYDKETEIGLSLWAALAGTSVLLLGPPGIAKSMIARRLKEAFKNAKAFEYLMSRFSTPDEIFGPVSIRHLRDSDQYERVTEGYLPTADVVFLDEIWKAGPAIQNSLLTVINEKVFRNGNKEIKIPLKLLIAASNELPAEGEGLEALWDRFLIRIVCSSIKKENSFYKMLMDEGDENRENRQWQISSEEYANWQIQISHIRIQSNVLTIISEIRKRLKNVDLESSELHRDVYISDRRWKNIVRLLKTSAFMHNRSEVSLADLLPIYHCLWNEPDEQKGVRHIIIESLFSLLDKQLDEIKITLASDLRITKVREALKNMNTDEDPWEGVDNDLLVVDHFFYKVDHHLTGNTFISIVDFRSLKGYDPVNAAVKGVMYKNPHNLKQTLIRTYYHPNKEETEKKERNSNQIEQVTLYRDSLHLFINGVRYPMCRLKKDENQEEYILKDISASSRDYDSELYNLTKELDTQKKIIEDNSFVSPEDKDCIEMYLHDIRKKIAWTRIDVQKLENG
jgi:MoxR-like ATPase